MNVELKLYTPLNICSDAIRTCWQSFDKSDTVCTDGVTKLGVKDLELIARVGNQFKHSSVLEHLHYTFYIKGISRACLQELSRHRMASPSVKSTRYTLKELAKEEEFSFVQGAEHVKQRASKYLVFTGHRDTDAYSVVALENLRKLLVSKLSNDIAKYCLPESYKTELTWTINARSLQNFLSLRTTPAALWEIHKLAIAIYDCLPIEHKYLFDDSLSK